MKYRFKDKQRSERLKRRHYSKIYRDEELDKLPAEQKFKKIEKDQKKKNHKLMKEEEMF